MKNSQNVHLLKEDEIKELKQYILQMEQEPQIYENLNQDQIFGIVVIILTKSSYHRTQYEIEILKKATKHIVYFQKLLEKDQGVLLWERCLRKMSYTSLKKGETLFREGDVGTTFYIILQGRVSIHKRMFVGDCYQEKELIQMNDGQAFGELALENNEPRSASITAVIPTHLAVLDAEDYMVIKKTVINQQRQLYFEEFAKLSIFKDWKFMSIKSLFDVMKLNKFRLNHTVYKEGDPANEVYFIQTGEFKVTTSKNLQVIKCLRTNKEHSNNYEQIDDDVEFLKQQFAYNKPSLTNQEKIDKLYQKKKYGNLIASDKKLIMTLKFLGAGEMFGELEILKAPDLCRQFSLVSTFESNNVYSVSKRDFMRVLNCDPDLNKSLISLNDRKLKQILQQIRVYEKNFIDQTEKINLLERTQNKSFLKPQNLLQIQENQQRILFNSTSQILKISSRIKLDDNRLREQTLTLDNPAESEQAYLNKLLISAQSVKHSRQKTEELIIQQSLKQKNKNRQQMKKHTSTPGALGTALENISYHIRRYPTQTSSNQRFQTSPSSKFDLDNTQKSKFYFTTCLPLVLQNNYYRLKTKQSQ
ncbi:unnamed protein product (macronuclear) [Paramecium tetraurelia]|uniref:Cyclic nucleotide-binding domain-containing protein n=1 Tax=Paramecium tetraurelia TaxID=5888 RepID=A0DYN8_PARTE|nr:uncharacterized protein GSPATT00003123001 [Paramecium tetraurelia]CAK88155.1 unnamed protein product [Paramecium tetraurelia]|eukprot:XP_001455552.1 hypothetical protein (macronuclear) [Paramecium tetraurelia strain d4-2]